LNDQNNRLNLFKLAPGADPNKGPFIPANVLAYNLGPLTVNPLLQDPLNLSKRTAEQIINIFRPISINNQEATPLLLPSYKKIDFSESAVPLNLFEKLLKTFGATLIELNLSSPNEAIEVTDEYLRLIGIHCPRIKTIDLSFCPRITNQGLNYLSSLQKLTSLNLALNRDLTSIALLSELPRLKSLNLRDCYRIKDLNPLSGNQTITDLTVIENETNQNLDFLKTLPNLESLNIRIGISENSRHYDYSFFENLTSLTSLKIDFLAFSNQTMYTQVLMALKKLNLLEELDLHSSRVDSNQVISLIAKISNIRTLCLHIQPNAKTDFSPLKQLPYLKKLSLFGSSDFNFSMKQLDFLKELPNLESLTLIEFYRIEGKPLTIFEECRTLKSLYLKKCCSESDKNIIELKEKRPDLEIQIINY
jgi:hypothetical protein